jgi:hypothetical protein
MAEAQLAKIAGVADVKQRTEQYKQLVADFTAAGNVAGLNAIVDHCTLLFDFFVCSPGGVFRV